MSDANIDVITDKVLLEIFERLPLLDQICASKVCRRWKALCQRFLENVYMLSYDGRTMRFERSDGTILIAKADLEAAKSVLDSCSEYIQKLKVKITRKLRDPSQLQHIMDVISAECDNLRLIEFGKIRDNIILRLIPIIIRRSKNLESLKLEGVQLLNLFDIVVDLPECLLEFQILNDIETDPVALVEVLATCPNLKRFGCNIVQDVVAELIGYQDHLEYLHLKYSFTISESFNHIAHLSNLTYLDIEGGIEFQDHNLENIVNNCQQLQCLIISLCHKITNIGIYNLSNLERLTELKMRELTKVTDASIAILPASLEVLHCCGCVKVLDYGVIQFLTRATNLRELYVNDTRITNLTIAAAITLVKDQESNRNLTLYAEQTRANVDTLDKTLIAQIPALLQLYLD